MEKNKLYHELRKVRELKKMVLSWEKSKFAKDDPEFLKRTTEFKRGIPLKNVVWMALNDIQIESRVTELVNEYAYLEAWSKRLYKTWDERLTKEWLNELTEGRDDQEQVVGQAVKEIFPDGSGIVQNEREPINKPGRGGSRLGAGRKAMGKMVKVSIALPDEDWEHIDQLVKSKVYSSVADYFRSLHIGAKSLLP